MHDSQTISLNIYIRAESRNSSTSFEALIYWGMHTSKLTHVCLQGLAYIRGHSLRDGVCKIFRKASRQVI